MLTTPIKEEVFLLDSVRSACSGAEYEEGKEGQKGQRALLAAGTGGR